MESTDDSQLRLAEDFKQKGNESFKLAKYLEAVELYTKAIDTHSSSAKAAPYYSNRAMSHLKMDNYGLALEDAKLSIKCDPAFVKGYYREGSAYLALSKLNEARDSFKQAFKLSPKDSDISEKLKKIRSMVIEREF